LARLTHWIGCHLVLLGFIGFALWGYAWRDPLLGALGDRGVSPGTVQAPDTAAPSNTAVLTATGSDAMFRPPLETEPAAPAELDAAALLQSARRAYWSGEPETAESRYRLYLERYPDDPAGHGELGNVLLSMGREPEAHEALRAAAERLRAAGAVEAAAELLQLSGGSAEASGGAMPD
jgi:tetratricopeptide (TPR) repeat protein